MKELDNILPKLTIYLTKTVNYVSKHRVIITFFVASGAIFASVIQAQVFLNPVRNEDLYIEQSASSATKTINQETVEKLNATQTDDSISVDSNFVTDRNNPFNE